MNKSQKESTPDKKKKELKVLELNDIIFRDTEANADVFTKSTLTSEKKETHGGVEYFVIPVEVSSASHPFYTGEERVIDVAGRVEKFTTRQSKSKKS